MAAAATKGLGMSSVRVVVVGDSGTGKSSLIVSIATESFPEHVPSVVPPTHLPADYFPDLIPVVVVDTSSSPDGKAKLIAECQAADVIVLTYVCDDPSTISRLSTYWLPELRRIEVKVPVILVGCKLDLRVDEHASLELVMAPIMQQFREVETCIECSAKRQIQVPEVFFYAQRAVLHPTSPLFDQETQSLKPRCARALKRIFLLCDKDNDGILSDAELNEFQVRCFNTPLQANEFAGIKKVVQEQMAEGVRNNGLTLSGFIFLYVLFIEKGRLETSWTVLRNYGYDNCIKLRDDSLQIPLKRAPDQTLELTVEALEFLGRMFYNFDSDKDGLLHPSEVENLFSTAPENPWSEGIYRDAAEKSILGGYTLHGFLSQWALMTLVDPKSTLANLTYIGHTGDSSSIFQVTRKRRLDRKKQQSTRNVYQCFVFGPRNSGKTSLLNSFIAKTAPNGQVPATSVRYAVNIIELPGGSKKTLVLREVPEDEVNPLLSNKDALASCDVAIFLYDSSDQRSWEKAKEMLLQVAAHGENNGFGVPCLVVSAKDDLDPYQLAVPESKVVTQYLGIETPIPISVQLNDLRQIFHQIVDAAQRPHLNIPETESGRNRKQFRQLVNHSLMFLSVGAAVAVAGVAAYRVYAARKNTSSSS